jgi:small subunit ribosomal protein S15
MPLTKERKQNLIGTYGKNEKDTGNTEVQVALLTDRINQLTEHLQANPNDHHTRYGLLKMVGQRRSLLDYLSRRDINHYRELITKLNIRK